MKQLLPLLLLFSLLTGNSSACTNEIISMKKEGVPQEKVDQGGDTQHEVFMYDSAVHYDRHSGQSEQFKGRVSHFQNELKHGNASIVIRKTKVIDNPILKDRREEKVAGAAAEPSVRILGQTQDGVLLQCLVRGASPEPKVEWQDSSGNIVPAAEPQVSEREGSFYITLNATVTKADHYRCVATQETLHHQIHAETYVPLNGAASEPSVKLVDQTNDWALLQCLVRGAFPKPRLQWTDSSGEVLPAAEPQVSERGGSFYITLNANVTKTDRYQCVVTQEEINHETRAETFVHFTGEEPERSSDSGSPIGWIVLSAVLSIIVVVAGVVVYKAYIKLNQLNDEMENLKKTEQRPNTPPADSATYPMISEQLPEP
ncbi:hypothetical protein NQZ68_024562 [Dissostichus eleginoides]|nr:hypothetical protein NQZ68_024562 [Dissostichus eleginoides]